MPKINANGNATYAGHQGLVTNAVGEQFEVDPTRDLNGERAGGYVDEPAEQPSVDTGDIQPAREDDDTSADTPRPVDHRQSEGRQDEGRTAAKKSAPAATKK